MAVGGLESLTGTLSYQEAGRGEPLLLVHGLLADSRAWEPLEPLLTRQFRVIRCDLRGHGATPRRPPGDRRDHADDLVELMRHLNLSGVHLVGQGSGCGVAAAAAQRAPQSLCSLTVIDPAIPRTENSPDIALAWHLEMLMQWLSVGHGATVREPAHALAIRDVVMQQTHARFGDSLPAAAPLGPGLAQADMGRLRELDCPVLALVGTESDAESKAMTATLYGRAPHFQMALVPGARRHSPREAPAVVALLLEHFLLG